MVGLTAEGVAVVVRAPGLDAARVKGVATGNTIGLGGSGAGEHADDAGDEDGDLHVCGSVEGLAGELVSVGAFWRGWKTKVCVAVMMADGYKTVKEDESEVFILCHNSCLRLILSQYAYSWQGQIGDTVWQESSP